MRIPLKCTKRNVIYTALNKVEKRLVSIPLKQTTLDQTGHEALIVGRKLPLLCWGRVSQKKLLIIAEEIKRYCDLSFSKILQMTFIS